MAATRLIPMHLQKSRSMDMSKELLDELKDLEKKCRSVNQRMKKDIARNS